MDLKTVLEFINDCDMDNIAILKAALAKAETTIASKEIEKLNESAKAYGIEFLGALDINHGEQDVVDVCLSSRICSVRRCKICSHKKKDKKIGYFKYLVTLRYDGAKQRYGVTVRNIDYASVPVVSAEQIEHLFIASGNRLHCRDEHVYHTTALLYYTYSVMELERHEDNGYYDIDDLNELLILDRPDDPPEDAIRYYIIISRYGNTYLYTDRLYKREYGAWIEDSNQSLNDVRIITAQYADSSSELYEY